VFGLLKRYRELLIVAVLLLLPLGVYFAHAKRQAELSRFDRTLLWLTSPVEKGIHWTVSGVQNGWYGYVALRHAHQKAEGLQRRLDLYELERQQSLHDRAENGRLHALLGMAEAAPERRYQGARVVGVRLDPKGLQFVTIDRGSDDGLERMMPVVVARGVVGRVHSVTASSADVLLLSDRNSSIAARVERSRARANVRGTGEPWSCRLDYALRAEDMVEGDVLVTSGTDGVYPRGLPVGKVTHLKRTGYGLYQYAEVVPAVEVTKLEEVLVITSPIDRAEEGAEPPPLPAPGSTNGLAPLPGAAPAPAPAAGAIPAQGAPAAGATSAQGAAAGATRTPTSPLAASPEAPR